MRPPLVHADAARKNKKTHVRTQPLMLQFRLLCFALLCVARLRCVLHRAALVYSVLLYFAVRCVALFCGVCVAMRVWPALPCSCCFACIASFTLRVSACLCLCRCACVASFAFPALLRSLRSRCSRCVGCVRVVLWLLRIGCLSVCVALLVLLMLPLLCLRMCLCVAVAWFGSLALFWNCAVCCASSGLVALALVRQKRNTHAWSYTTLQRSSPSTLSAK